MQKQVMEIEEERVQELTKEKKKCQEQNKGQFWNCTI